MNYEHILPEVGISIKVQVDILYKSTLECRTAMQEQRILGKDVLGRVIRDFSSAEWFGIPRKEIK